MVQRYRPAAMLDIVEFADEHLDAAAELLAERHVRHRVAEPLLPEVDFRAQIESEWLSDGASGVFASRDGEAVGYLFGRPQAFGWFTVGIGGHALRGEAEEARAASREGRTARLVEPDEMVPPLLYVVSREADKVNGYRFDANAWDATLAPADAASRAGRPAGFVLHPQE